jgi:hypothetical protein
MNPGYLFVREIHPLDKPQAQMQFIDDNRLRGLIDH